MYTLTKYTHLVFTMLSEGYAPVNDEVKDTVNNTSKAGREVIAAIRQATNELRGTIAWDSQRKLISNILETNPDVAEFIDHDETSVLQAAAESPKTADIADSIIRTIGFGKRDIINYQGKVREVLILCSCWLYYFIYMYSA